MPFDPAFVSKNLHANCQVVLRARLRPDFRRGPWVVWAQGGMSTSQGIGRPLASSAAPSSSGPEKLTSKRS